MEILYLLYIYIYIYCKSHQVWQTQLVRKEKTCKRVQLVLPPPCGSGLFLLLLDLALRLGGDGGAGREKRMLLKKIKWKRRGLFLSLLLFLLPCLLSPSSPPPPPEFSLLESLDSNWHLNTIGGLGALGPMPLNQTHIPAH